MDNCAMIHMTWYILMVYRKRKIVDSDNIISVGVVPI